MARQKNKLKAQRAQSLINFFYLLFLRNEKGTNSLGMSDITEHNTILFVNASGWVRYVRTLTATFQCAMDLKVIISESNSVFTPTARPIPRVAPQKLQWMSLVLVSVKNGCGEGLPKLGRRSTEHISRYRGQWLRLLFFVG